MPAQAHNRGLTVVDNNIHLVHLSDKGIGVHYFSVLQAHTQLSKTALARLLGIDPGTVDNYLKTKKKFSGEIAEKLLKLHRLFALGEELFGSVGEFQDWLKLPSPGLEGQVPMSLLHSNTGIDEIEKQLQRIIHGYVA